MNILNQTIKDYKFISFINKGGFGAVYKAQKATDFFAIKVFHEEYVLREYKKHGENNRLQREIEIMKSVSHKYLVEYVDDFIVEDESGKNYFLVMKFIEGHNLREILNQEEKLNEEKALELFKQILEGLDYLHNHKGENDDTGIIHRDLKPENIIIQNNGQIKIVDFGISKVIDFTSLTSTGEIFGTGPYMSPEQITDSKHLDKRSDLYTAGVILYEILTGYYPYDFQYFPELIEKIKNENEYPIRPNSRGVEISSNVENTILKLLENKPYNRYTNVTQILADISQVAISTEDIEYDLTPRFILRLNNDKTLLSKYAKRNPNFGTVVFPAHLFAVKQYIELLANIKASERIIMITDPSTNRLAYDGFHNKESLAKLSYAPDQLSNSKYEVITPTFLSDNKKLLKYVHSAMDHQIQIGADIVMAPFHHLSNSTTISSSSNQNSFFDWLDLDYKLAMEAILYCKNKALKKSIYIGISFQEDILHDESVTKQILNKYSLLSCDGFIVYIDKISIATSAPKLYKYIRFLQELQKSTKKPVFAGRIGTIGLGLMCAGITGFTSGASERDTYYEDLLKDEEGHGGIPVKYYFEKLLGSIIIPNRKDSNGNVPAPIKYTQIVKHLGVCNCHFCVGKEETQIIKAANVKLHFMEKIYEEVDKIKKTPIKDRKEYFLSRINQAIDYYEQLKIPAGIKPSEYAHLNTWKEVFENL